MSALVRCATALCFVIVLAYPIGAQNAGGLPGTEHVLARKAYEQAPRVILHGDVVHYQFDVRVGPGPFDTIRMHRVVKETMPGVPEKKMPAVLLLAGSPQTFDIIFLPEATPSVPPDQGSVALFLATRGIDVWGMDYGWTSIPYPTTDFGFLSDWGIDKDVAHTLVALSIARHLRVTSGQGNDPMHLLGFSYGGFLVYAVAGEDTVLPGNLRNVQGIIPVDGSVFKQPMGSSAQLSACNSAASTATNLEAGIYYTNNSATMLNGQLALAHPDDPNPASGAALPALAFPAYPPYTFTNYEAPLVNAIRTRFLSGTYTVSPPGLSLFYTDGNRFVTLMSKTPPYIPLRTTFDGHASRCGTDTYPVAFDDHLGDIDVPILYIARQETAFYTTTLTRSFDVTKVLINPTLDPSLYGHADFFTADNAASAIWQTILDWILAHR